MDTSNHLTADPASDPAPLSGPEALKLASEHLRGTIRAELGDADLAAFSNESGTLLKFHGIYQQDDRDIRRERTQAKEALEYSCMVRCSVPGGRLRPEQWFEIDRLADEISDGRLRLTSRQGVQYHFVNKGDLHSLVNQLNCGLVTTYAACGDVVRNVMVTSAPYEGRNLERLDSLARALAGRFRPQSEAYWELWLDGERALSSGPAPTLDLTGTNPGVEPIYGDRYLPRKFKIGVAEPGDNSIDVYSQDCGIVPIDSPDGEPGAVFIVGGGLGRSHSDDSTFPRLGDPMAWVAEDDIPDVAEAIVTLFRDFGNREDRSHARLKYVVEEKGIAWVREEVERRIGKPLADPLPLPAWGGSRDYLGWHRQTDDTWFIGLPVPSGRLDDQPGRTRKTAVRAVLENFANEIRITPQDDVLLCGISDHDKPAVEALLDAHGVPRADQLSLSVISSMACPALPTCGQALGEAERVLPELTDLLDSYLGDRGLGDVRIETRMTGCANGCARPYVAELGVIARTKTAYDVWLGGNASGTRLAKPVIEGVPFRKLGDVLGPLLDRYKSGRLEGEGFGDWANRLGVAALSEGLPTFARPGQKAGA
ncbi:MAG: NADPH-dependent assimilatory sulfite reductase hemoprotein subunit [Acidimicrobiales bacterium]